MKYKFGVMSTLYELESESLRTAKLAMVLFLETSAPIAIYNKEETAFNPTKLLMQESKKQAPEDLKEVMNSITKCELNSEEKK